MELLILFLVFCKISIIGFGGGYGIMSLMFAEIARFGITAERFADLVAIELVVPGPLAINAATFVGYIYKSFPGAVIATLGVCLPCGLASFLVLKFISAFRENRMLSSFLAGVKPAAIGLIASAGLSIAISVLYSDSEFSIVGALIIVGVFVSQMLKASPILMTLIAAIVGAIFIR